MNAPDPALHPELQPSQAVLDTLRVLVGFNTVSRESNLGLIEWARDALARHGLKPRLTYDADGRKANLFATVGDGDAPGMVLSGHTDTVPVDGQAWDTDPFILSGQDGRLYGRGTADMKGFIAVALASVPKMLAGGSRRPIHLALSYDEEVGCFGVQRMLQDLRQHGIKPGGCIVGEPSSMQPIVAHKGTHRFRCCVRGLDAHSALPNLGVNAIEFAAKIVVRLREIGERYARLETRDYGFPVPYTTMQTTMMSGGIAQNVIPRDCEFLVDVRTLPGTGFDRIYEEVQAYAKTLESEMREGCVADASHTGIGFEFIAGIDGFTVDENAEIVKLAARLAHSTHTTKVSFGTEAGIFAGWGVPTVVLGPGSIEQAHQPNEYVEMSQLAQCERFVERLIAD